MVLYRLFDRLLPRSYLAKLLAAVLLCAQAPILAALFALEAEMLAERWRWPGLALALGVGAGVALSVLNALLAPLRKIEAALRGCETGTPSPQPASLPDHHRDMVGGMMARLARLVRAQEVELKAARRMADLDPLTGMLNRRGLEHALSHRTGGGAGGALLMLDCDHFKRINDVHGHGEGDRVLRQIALILRAALRPQDLAARVGGEEFVLYLDRAGRERALHVAERLRMRVEDNVDVAGDAQSASIGIALWPEGLSFPPVLKRADDAVYLAKSRGRNRVMLWADMAPEPDPMGEDVTT